MLLESVFETLRRIENERLQLPIFYESPIALRFETGDPSLDIFLDKAHLNPKYLRSAFWRVSFLYEKIAPFAIALTLPRFLPPLSERQNPQTPGSATSYSSPEKTVPSHLWGSPFAHDHIHWDYPSAPPRRWPDCQSTA